MPHRFENIDFIRTLNSIPKDVIEKFQRQENEQNKRDFISLCESLKEGKCSLCGHTLDYCDESSPCFHILLNPQIKRKMRQQLFNKPISFIKLYTYLSWIANSDKPFENINDLPSDPLSNHLFESTIRYKNIEWSFSLKPGDYEGHKGKQVGSASHYHFQMMVDGNVVIPYNKTHIQFDPYDYLYFEMIKQNAVKVDLQYAAGMDTLRDKLRVSVIPEGHSVIFDEFISEEETHRTIVSLATISYEQIQEIGECFSKSENQVYQIIDYLNSCKGYKILYEVYALIKDNPTKKARRD